MADAEAANQPCKAAFNRVGLFIDATSEAAVIVGGIEAARGRIPLVRPARSYGALEGASNYQVYDATGNLITDIDLIERGTLWEAKSPVFALDEEAWVQKHVNKKFERYMKARQNLPGYEDAPIGFKFEHDPATTLRTKIEAAINDLKKQNPDVTIYTEWQD